MLAMLLALATLFAGLGALTQNPTSGGYQLFERAASGISADIQLVSLENFAPPPESASEYANAPNKGPRFVTDAGGNTIDLNFTKGLSQTNVTVTGSRGGVQYPLQGQTPNSYANLGNGHAVVYGSDGRALYDVSGSRIKVVEWNQAPNGNWFPKKGTDTKAFEGNVPQSVLDDLGLN